MTHASGGDRPEVAPIAAFLRDDRHLALTDDELPVLDDVLRAMRKQRNGQGYGATDRHWLEERPDAVDALVERLTTRLEPSVIDVGAWSWLLESAFPDWLRSASHPIRVWVPNCGTGASAYAVLAVIGDAIGGDALRSKIEVVATDRSPQRLRTARAGVLPQRDYAGVSTDVLARWFRVESGEVAVPRDLRRIVTFVVNDLEHDQPTSQVAVVAAGYALSAFRAPIQVRLAERFSESLQRDGYLVTGRRQVLPDRSRHLFHEVAHAPGLKRRSAGSGPFGYLSDRGPVRCLLAGHSQVSLEGIARVLDDTSGSLVEIAGIVDLGCASVSEVDDVEVVVVDGTVAMAADYVSELRLEQPDLGVVVLAGDGPLATGLVEAGAAAVVAPHHEPTSLVGVLLAVAEGWRSLQSDAVEHLNDAVEILSKLDDHDKVLWRLLALGRFDSEIARELFVSERTVKRRVATLLRRLGVSRRIEAARLAGEAGLLSADGDGQPGSVAERHAGFGGRDPRPPKDTV